MNPIVLTISYDPTTGQVTVSGPVDNRATCYSLLELARDAIKDQNQKAAELLVARPPTGLHRM